MILKNDLRKGRLFVALFLCVVPTLVTARALPESREQLQLSFAPVVQQAAPAVVNIYTKRKVVERIRSPFAGDPFFEQFFGGRETTASVNWYATFRHGAVSAMAILRSHCLWITANRYEELPVT